MAKRAVGLNDEAWQNLFAKYDILNRVDKDGTFCITADQIKEFREPRLMVKFDHKENLPKLFKQYNLAILPVTRGNYVISHFDVYHKLEDINEKPTRISIPDYIQSLTYGGITSEALALNCAMATGLMQDFMEDEKVSATVSGRMGSGTFSFLINDVISKAAHHVQVENSQIEIDAGYEGVNSLALMEAKMDLSNDFMVRQLYYPFRTWSQRMKKPVRPIFLTYSNGMYQLHEYAFTDPDNYNSLKLVKARNYQLDDAAISVKDIESVMEMVSIVMEPDDVPFPQADTFARVINLCELLNEKPLTKADITVTYDFTSRQTDYYSNAAIYLGLIEKFTNEDGTLAFTLTQRGENLINASVKQRQLELCACMLEHKVFNDTLRLYLKQGRRPEISQIVDIMKSSSLKLNTEKTYHRRAQTVRPWIDWVVNLTKN